MAPSLYEVIITQLAGTPGAAFINVAISMTFFTANDMNHPKRGDCSLYIMVPWIECRAPVEKLRKFLSRKDGLKSKDSRL